MKIFKHIHLFMSLICCLFIISPMQANNDKLHVMYEEYPSSVYKNQVFKIKLKLISYDIDFDSIEILFEKNNQIKVLNPHSQWQFKGDNVFFNTYYISLSSLFTHLPQISISTLLYQDVNTSNKEVILNNVTSYIYDAFSNQEENDELSLDTPLKENTQIQENIVIGTANLAPKKIHISSIKWSKNYSHLIASEFKIINYNTKIYSNTHNLITLEIESKYGNLYDFNIHSKDMLEQKLEIIQTTLPYSKAKYQALVSKNLKYFRFNYFNVKKSTFTYKSLPIWLEHETVSTQTDINPSTNNFRLLKIIFTSVAILFFIALFIFNKKYIYLIGVGIFVFILIKMLIPLESIVLKENIKIKILPMEKSTVFYITKKETKAKIIKYKNNFIKIIFNNKIGWINENAINK